MRKSLAAEPNAMDNEKICEGLSLNPKLPLKKY